MSLHRFFPVFLFFFPSLNPSLASGQSPPHPPRAPQKEHISIWHEKKFNDPFFWLREKTNPEVRKYLEAENAYTEAMTSQLQPFADALYQEMLGHIKQTDLGVPVRRGAFYYYSRVQEGKQYPIRCRKKVAADGSWNDKAQEEVILDQNELAKGLKFLSIGATQVSDDGNLLAVTPQPVEVGLSGIGGRVPVFTSVSRAVRVSFKASRPRAFNVR
jgi:oligopeptidase B